MADNLWWTVGATVAKYVTRAVSEVDWVTWLAPKPPPFVDDVDQGSQRSLALTHTLPPTVPAHQAPPLVVFAEPTDAVIQLLNLTTYVSPELVMGMCAVGVLSLLVLLLFCLCTCARCIGRWTFWPFARRNRTCPPSRGQLSDMAMHYYSIVQAQNPELLDMTLRDIERRNTRRR